MVGKYVYIYNNCLIGVLDAANYLQFYIEFIYLFFWGGGSGKFLDLYR